MKNKRIIGLILAVAVVFSGCNTVTPAVDTTASSSEASETTRIILTEAEPEAPETDRPAAEKAYRFNPHLYSKKIGDIIPKENYEALYNLIDALREGRDTFECASEDAYKWATEDTTMNNLFPAACMKVTGKSNDGTTPFENGIGRVYLNMSAEEFIKRETQYESEIEEILNTTLEADDDDFEKAIKLYDYMESTFKYGEIVPSETHDGADYKAFQLKTGVCDNIASIYAYLLMQSGVDALNIGTFEQNVCHAWTYAIVNGKSYHIDATWALKDGSEDLHFDYFMMSDKRREESGCPLNDITVPLLPRYWANNYDNLDFKTADNSFDVINYSTFKRLDEAKKILYYTDINGNEQQLSYA